MRPRWSSTFAHSLLAPRVTSPRIHDFQGYSIKECSRIFIEAKIGDVIASRGLDTVAVLVQEFAAPNSSYCDVPVSHGISGDHSDS